MFSGEFSEPEALKCPRCDSHDTKFCYYNNYSTTQPRHFCKNCKRYWTAGGTLRNVPVGGGLRKNKKSKHVQDMGSTGADEFLSPGNPTPLLLASPSSSADGVVDEILTYPVLTYSPYFETAAESVGTGNHAPTFDYARNFGGHIYGQPLPVEVHLNHSDQRFCQPHFGPDYVDQAQSNNGEISESSSEISQASQNFPAVLQTWYPASFCMMYQGYREQGTNAEYNASDTRLRKLEQPNKHDSLRLSAEEHVFDGKPQDRSSTEDDDEELGNVINVRYPYDWEQVSEVLFAGMPDFFHMPSF